MVHRYGNVEIGMRPRSFITGNIFIEFSAQCICGAITYKTHTKPIFTFFKTTGSGGLAPHPFVSIVPSAKRTGPSMGPSTP